MLSECCTMMEQMCAEWVLHNDGADVCWSGAAQRAPSSRSAQPSLPAAGECVLAQAGRIWQWMPAGLLWQDATVTRVRCTEVLSPAVLSWKHSGLQGTRNVGNSLLQTRLLWILIVVPAHRNKPQASCRLPLHALSQWATIELCTTGVGCSCEGCVASGCAPLHQFDTQTGSHLLACPAGDDSN